MRKCPSFRQVERYQKQKKSTGWPVILIVKGRGGGREADEGETGRKSGKNKKVS